MGGASQPRPVFWKGARNEQKGVGLLLAVALLWTAVGCGAAPSAESATNASAARTREDGAEAPQKSETAETSRPAEDVEAGGDDWIVWEDLFLQGVELLETEELDGLRYGQTEEQVEALWGTPGEKTEPEVWAADGLAHTWWRYDGLSFAGGVLQFAAFVAPRPGKTLAGVGLGSTEEVREADGDRIDEESSTEERLVAGSVYGGLIFTLEEGAVTKAFLGAAAE